MAKVIKYEPKEPFPNISGHKPEEDLVQIAEYAAKRIDGGAKPEEISKDIIEGIGKTAGSKYLSGLSKQFEDWQRQIGIKGHPTSVVTKVNEVLGQTFPTEESAETSSIEIPSRFKTPIQKLAYVYKQAAENISGYEGGQIKFGVDVRGALKKIAPQIKETHFRRYKPSAVAEALMDFITRNGGRHLQVINRQGYDQNETERFIEDEMSEGHLRLNFDKGKKKKY